MVKRYDLESGMKWHGYLDDGGSMKESLDGDYVLYEDYEKLEKQLADLKERLRWIPVDYQNDDIPKYTPILCRLKWCGSGKIVFHVLISVESDDHSWETADDKSEISFDLDVTHYMLIPELEIGE